MAYGVQDFQISGPDWLGSAKFDIVATVGKSGPKLQQVEPGGTSMNTGGKSAAQHIQAERVSTAQLAETPAAIMEHPVVDQAGLPGAYKVNLEYLAGAIGAQIANIEVTR